MGIKDLLENIGKENLAGGIDQDKLDAIGERVKERFDEDVTSMKDWNEQVEEGLKLMKQEYKPKSIPWDGASNFKSPIMSEASIAFGDKASLEILRARNLVKADIIGRDKSGEKKKLSERVTEAMNYQVNYQMTDWREDQKRLLYVMPNVGCMFKKTVFDPLEGRTVSHIIQYPDFAVNQATTNLDKARSFTQILDVDQNGLIERQNAGIWLKVDIYPEGADGDEGSNEKNETETAEENEDRFLEQWCFADLDGDGYEEPYIITVHEQTRKILRIVARYDFNSFIIKTREGRVISLVEAIKADTVRAKQAGEALPLEADVSGFELVKIVPARMLVKYGFIPSFDGTFLDLGYSHLMGAIVQSLNSTTNQLTDAGTLRNLGGGFLAKGFRKKMGPMRMKPGEYHDTNIAARDLQTGILPNPNPEPSTVLFALNEKLEKQGKSFAAIVDVSGQIQANTAPTTALAIIQEALVSSSALMGRVIDSMSKEFQILFNLNKTTFDPELYKKILDDQQIDAKADFNNDSLDIVPTASPEMSSKLQRIQLATVEMEQVVNGSIVAAGGNPSAVVRNFFEMIGSQIVDEVFPEEPTDEQAKEIAKANEIKQIELKIQQEQLRLSSLQTEVLMREQERLDADTKRKIQETIGKLEQMKIENILTLEKAETEETKNRINVYTTQLDSNIAMMTAIGAENDRAFNQRSERQAQQRAN